MGPLDLAVVGRLTDSAILLVDEHGRIFDADPAIDGFLGLEPAIDGPSNLIDSVLADLVVDPNAMTSYLQRCRRTSHPIPGVLSWQLGDGAKVTFGCRGNRLSRGDPRVAICLQPKSPASAFEDLNRRLHRAKDEVLKRRRVESELRRSTELNKLILSSTAEGILGLDTDGVLTLCNPAALRMLAYNEPNELVGKDLRSLLLDDRSKNRDTSEIRSGLVNPRETLDLRSDREILWRRDGSSFPIEYRTRLIKQDGELKGWVVSFVDISARLEEEERQRAYETVMHEAQKLEGLGRLAGGVAHDFNNFLLTIIGNADMARRRISESSPAHGRLQTVLDASYSAAGLCRQMLAYAGRGKVTSERILLSRLVHEISDLLKVSIHNNVSVRFEISPDESPIQGDPSQIRQVVMNLLINASDAIGDENGTIDVRIGSVEVDLDATSDVAMLNHLDSGMHTSFEVVDSGEGIEPEHLKSIFDPFYSTKDAGHGLGLAATLGIVRAHRGFISVDSTPGVGTTFRLLFPVSRSGLPEDAVETLDDDWRGSGEAMVVDDNPSVARVVASILTEIGFIVHAATSGEEAIELFKQHKRRLVAVISDVSMPGVDGFALFEALRDIDPSVPVMLSSGLEDEDSVHRRAGEGLAGFLAKPYSRGQLVGKLRRVLEGMSRSKQLSSLGNS